MTLYNLNYGVGDGTQETPTVTPSETPLETSTDNRIYVLNETGRRILEYCIVPRSSKEIMEHLGLKDKKNLIAQIRKLIGQGRIARTVPDNPNNRNQRYFTIK